MNNRYHLSYDVIDSAASADRSDSVRKSLLQMLYDRLKAENVKRPTGSTIVFDSNKDDREVSAVIEEWRLGNVVYYYLSKVADNYDKAGAGYIRKNESLNDNIVNARQEGMFS